MALSQYSVKDLAGMVQRARKVLDEIPLRREECAKAGHHLGYYELPYVISNRSNILRDRVSCGCKHCLSFFNRPLNESEASKIYEFRKSLTEHVLR